MHPNGGIESERGDIPKRYPQQLAIFPAASISHVQAAAWSWGLVRLRGVHLFALAPISWGPYNRGKQQIQTLVLVHCLGLCHIHTGVAKTTQGCAESG